jgi:hypothetical protein
MHQFLLRSTYPVIAHKPQGHPSDGFAMSIEESAFVHETFDVGLSYVRRVNDLLLFSRNPFTDTSPGFHLNSYTTE